MVNMERNDVVCTQGCSRSSVIVLCKLSVLSLAFFYAYKACLTMVLIIWIILRGMVGLLVSCELDRIKN